MNFKAQRASLKDLLRISNFFKENFTGEGRYGTVDLFSWKTATNPLGDGFVNFVEIDGEVAATTSITRKRLKCCNEVIDTAEIGDTYTAPKFFRRGLFTIVGNASRDQAEADGMRYIYGLPNATALPGWQKKANFEVQSSLNVRAMSLATSADNKLLSLFGWTGMELFGGPFRLALGLFYKLRNRHKNNIEDYVAERLESLPDDWNEFWEEASQRHDFIICRTKDEMTWRYFLHPDKYLFDQVRHKGKLVGYLVYKNVPTDLGYSLIIADYLFLSGHDNALRMVLSELVNTAFRTKTRGISVWCDRRSPFYKTLVQYGFADRHEIPVIIYNNEVKDALNAVQRPHFTMGDSDNV